jgi:hypothetical protein
VRTTLSNKYSARLQGRDLGPDGRLERSVDGAPFLHAEQIDPQTILQENLMAFDDVGLFAHVGDAGVGGRKR